MAWQAGWHVTLLPSSACFGVYAASRRRSPGTVAGVRSASAQELGRAGQRGQVRVVLLCDLLASAPDLGAVKIAEHYASLLHRPVAVVRKTRMTGATVDPHLTGQALRQTGARQAPVDPGPGSGYADSFNSRLVLTHPSSD
jgi:hypothetical protein